MKPATSSIPAIALGAALLSVAAIYTAMVQGLGGDWNLSSANFGDTLFVGTILAGIVTSTIFALHALWKIPLKWILSIATSTIFTLSVLFYLFVALTASC